MGRQRNCTMGSVMFHDLYSTPNITIIKLRAMWWAGHVAQWDRTAGKVLSEKPEGKRLFRRTRHPSDSNIKIEVKETVLKSENWIRVAQDKAKWWAPWTRYWIYGSYKKRRISHLPADVLPFQEEFCSIKLVFWRLKSATSLSTRHVCGAGYLFNHLKANNNDIHHLLQQINYAFMHFVKHCVFYNSHETHRLSS